MNKLFSSLLLAGVVILTSCSKDQRNNLVNVRLQNGSKMTFDSMKVVLNYYGKLKPNQQTSYQIIKEYIEQEGSCSYTIQGCRHFIGGLRCATPPLPPQLPAGYYNFRIEDSAGYYIIKVIRE